jgi:hypothetical protein
VNSYYEIDRVKSIILKDANAMKFTLGVKGVTEFRKCPGPSSDLRDYDVEVWADDRPCIRIASEFIAFIIFKEGT